MSRHLDAGTAQNLKCGERVEIRIGFGRDEDQWVPATIVMVSHDNRDNGVVPFSQVTLRRDYPSDDVVYSGPQIFAWVRPLV